MFHILFLYSGSQWSLVIIFISMFTESNKLICKVYILSYAGFMSEGLSQDIAVQVWQIRPLSILDRTSYDSN